jgi:hypothetical protein
MGVVNKLNIGKSIQESEPHWGYTEDFSVPLSEWTLNTGVAVGARADGGVGREAVATSLNGIVWDDTADATDIIRFDWTLPGQFKSEGVGRDDVPVLKLLVKARTRDTTGSATANADLALNAQVFFHAVGGTAVSTLSAAISKVVGATDFTDATEEGFAWYEYDIYTAMTAAQKSAIGPLTTMQIQLLPNEAIGTALYIDVVGTVIRYKRHASLESKSAR